MSEFPMCPRCSSRLIADRWTESEYGYGGWTGNTLDVGVEITCTNRKCTWKSQLGFGELGELALGEYYN